MGRYLENGIMTKFYVIKKECWYSNKNFSIEKEMKRILEDLDKVIDTSLYELTSKEEERYEFSLKLEVFNKNIHSLIGELSSLTYPNTGMFYNLESIMKTKKIDLKSKDFNENYPLTCILNKDGNCIIEGTDEDEIIESGLFFPLYWMVNDDYLRDNIKIRVIRIPLWMDFNKYDGEDSTQMLRIMNHMKLKYYNNELAKALIYYVTD